MEREMIQYCIGIDLGGSFIKFGLLDSNRKAGKPMELPTPSGGTNAVVTQMVSGAKQLLAANGLTAKDVVGVGIGAPGPLKISEGIVISSPNIPGLENAPLSAMISKGLGLPAVLENDANAAGYGEYLWAAQHGVRNLVFLTLGTGVGGGVVVDGKVLHGAHEIGAELGHIIVQPNGEQCNCGQKGCLERYSSATFMAFRAQRMIEENGRASSLKEVLKKNGKLNSKDINEARKAGDALAAEVWDDAARYLALACVSVVRILDPDEIVLGGGMANAGNDLLDVVNKHYHANIWKLTKPLTAINLARLGNDAGFVGAAGVAWDAFGKS